MNHEPTEQFVLELENGTFAVFLNEYGMHMVVDGVTDFMKATLFKNEMELNNRVKDMEKFLQHGWGFHSQHPTYQYSGQCIVPKEKRRILSVLTRPYHEQPAHGIEMLQAWLEGKYVSPEDFKDSLRSLIEQTGKQEKEIVELHNRFYCQHSH